MPEFTFDHLPPDQQADLKAELERFKARPPLTAETLEAAKAGDPQAIADLAAHMVSGREFIALLGRMASKYAPKGDA